LKKILITGGAGFIGSHLAEACLARGDEVYVLDDLSTGNLENILTIKNDSRFHFILGSILEKSTLDGLVERCDYIFHLAAAVGVKLVYENPVYTINVNVKGTENVLNAGLRFAKKVFLASTSEVYGKDVRPDRLQFRESDDLSLGTSLRWCYGCSKALDEYLGLAYHKKMGLPVVVGRFFNTVGPRQSGAYGMVLPRLVRQALLGQPLTVYGDGRQVRSFSWVKDVVRATLELMECPQAVGEVVNIGSEEGISIIELAQKIKAKTGSSSEINFIPYHLAYGPDFEDIFYRVPDTSKLRQLIGFAPSLNLDKILDEVIAYEREQLEKKPAGA
jgi:UDP-glucose 4-epimerase